MSGNETPLMKESPKPKMPCLPRLAIALLALTALLIGALVA